MSQAGIQTPAESPTPALGRSFAQRLVGALRLDSAAYDEIAADSGALGQAAGVAVAAAVARAIGSPAGPTSGEAFTAAISVLLMWPVLGGLVWAIGGWFGHPAKLPMLLRVMGFAMAPMLLWVLNVVPVTPLQVGASFLALALLIASSVVGIRQALAVPTGRAGFIFLVVALLAVFLTMVLVYLRSITLA